MKETNRKRSFMIYMLLVIIMETLKVVIIPHTAKTRFAINGLNLTIAKSHV